MEPLVKATVIDGIAATEGRDSQGEILKLSGCDISQMTTKGYLNDNHGTGFLNTLGRITHAKKIFKEEDCEDDRQKMFWKQAGKPYLYVKGYLFDDADHPNAKAVAAIMKEFQKMGTPLDVKYSVEGKVLDRAHYDRSVLAQSMVRNVALTLVPANGETAAAVAGRINKSMDLIKSEGGKAVAACVERMVKSIAAGAQPQNRWDLPTDEERAEALLKKIKELTDLLKMAKGDIIPMGDRRGKAQGPAEGGKAEIIQAPMPPKGPAVDPGEAFVRRAVKGNLTSKDMHHSRAWQHHMEHGGDRAGEGNDHADAHYRMAHYHAKALGMDSVGMESYVGYTPRKKKLPRKFTPHPADHLVGKVDPYRTLNKMMSPGYGGAGVPGTRVDGAALAAKVDTKRKALKEVIKSTLAMNPGVSLSKALEMVLSEFRKRFGD